MGVDWIECHPDGTGVVHGGGRETRFTIRPSPLQTSELLVRFPDGGLSPSDEMGLGSFIVAAYRGPQVKIVD